MDGDTLSQEIGGNQLAKEIAEETEGAGIKDQDELQDILHAIKGSEVFILKTPSEQLKKEKWNIFIKIII